MLLMNKTCKCFYSISLVLVLMIFQNCRKEVILPFLKKPDVIISNNEVPNELILRNRINLKLNAPFYILKNNTFLYFHADSTNIKEYDVNLSISDVVFPVLPFKEINNKFYCETISGDRGWIDILSGISTDYSEDKNLYFFTDTKPQYYLSHYKENKGVVSSSYKIILYKNIIPMLLGNFQTSGWFYPVDIETALQLSEYAVEISNDSDTFFYASTMFDNWRINEKVISMNLLADCYHKKGELEKAAEIHNLLIKRYFWKRSDNTQIGGLNSTVKLAKIYIDLMLMNKENVKEYAKYRELIISTMLTMDDKINFLTVMDNDWNQTASEWMIDILSRSIEADEFIRICDILRSKTNSDGYADLVNVHKAIKLYETGQKETAMKILVGTKSKIQFQRFLDLNDWISEKQIIPDSVIYQYERF